MVCRVCLKRSELELQIFDQNGVEQQIPQILQLHLWFTPSPEDPISKAICLPCWLKLLEFHQFYEAAKEAHKFYEDQHEIVTNAKYTKTLKHPEETVVGHEDATENIWVYSREDVSKPKNIYDNTETITSLYEIKVLEPITIKTESSETKKFEKCLDNGKANEFYQDHHEILVNVQNTKTLRHPVEILKHEDANNDIWIGEGKDIYTQRSKNENSEIISPLHESEFVTIKTESPETKGITKRAKRMADNFQNDYADDDDGGSSDDSQSGNESENITKTTENTTKSAKRTTNERKRNCDKYLKDLRRHKEASKIISCEICGIFVEGRLALTSHKQDAHAVEQFNCNLCSKTFTRKVSLKEHMAKHLGERLYKCPFCDRTFNSSANMYSHRKKGHPIEYEKWCWKRKTNQLNCNLNLNCNLCSKTFKHQISLKEHMARHSGERLYKCSFCPRTSNSSANMYAHRKKQHPVEYEIWRKTKFKLCLHTSSSPT